jgi:spore coat polysaccharide biosynthesis predicted glycosyltransferase SpsG
MNLTIACKASSKTGLGHLFRSLHFIKQLPKGYFSEVDFILIGDVRLSRLVSTAHVNLQAFTMEEEVIFPVATDVFVLDMIEASDEFMCEVTNCAKKKVIISPIFNQFDKVDYYFGRTKRLMFSPSDYPKLKVYAGLQYTIVQENCLKIDAGTFERHLDSDHFPVGIVMGGGDANNKTLEMLKALKECTFPATFWVMVGEGYKHSLDDLSDEIRRDTEHEIILAKTNKNMWRVLQNCVCCIVPGGVTTYEALYAGLPTLNFYENESQKFLLEEIVEVGGALSFGAYSFNTIQAIVAKLDSLFQNKKELLQMHVNTKGIVDSMAVKRIVEAIME